MGFKAPKIERFKTGRLDILVFMIVLSVFLWAFCFDSFIPLRNETGEIIYDWREIRVTKINMQFFIAPLIMVYEMVVLILLDGKPKGRSLLWGLYLATFIFMTKKKFREGMEEYHEWKKIKKK